MKAWTLNLQERKALNQRIQCDSFLGNQIPKHLTALAQTWCDDSSLRVTAFAESPQHPLVWVFDRGVAFEHDWVRSTWAISTQREMDWVSLGRVVRVHYYELGTRFLRWTVPHTISTDAQVIFERLGAIPIGWDDDNDVTYSWGLDHPNFAYQTRGKFSLGNPRIEDFEAFQSWFNDPEIESAVTVRTLMARKRLRDNLYNPVVASSYFAPLSILSIRKNEELVGFAVEHSWDFSFDGFREFDIALPNLAKKSIRTVPDLYCSLIDRVFRRGASRVMTASRVGASQNGYPILYKHIGGTDITQSVLGFGMGDTNRRYYATNQDTFYQSRLGKPFLEHQPYKGN